VSPTLPWVNGHPTFTFSLPKPRRGGPTVAQRQRSVATVALGKEPSLNFPFFHSVPARTPRAGTERKKRGNQFGSGTPGRRFTGPGLSLQGPFRISVGFAASEPGGFTAISRWLSEVRATPPDPGRITPGIPEGCQRATPPQAFSPPLRPLPGWWEPLFGVHTLGCHHPI